MDELWRLIQNEAESISAYLFFLRSDFAKTAEAEPLATTIQHIIGEKRDHLEALKYLHDAMTKNKAATGTTDFAHKALEDYRDKNKLIK